MPDSLFADWIVGLFASLIVGVALMVTGRLKPTYNPCLLVLGGVGFAAVVSLACFMAVRLTAKLVSL